jgi:hypothetical protein
MDLSDRGVSFRFRRSDNIGTPDAESDDSFFDACFVDTGDLHALRDCDSPKRIIVGRTGAGKSALIRRLQETADNVITLRPTDLSLNYLANSEVIAFFEEAGTNLDAFYQLLWKHVLAVELIRRKYQITNENSQRTFFEGLQQIFSRNRAKQEAINYLKKWGDNFWNESEIRVKEVLKKIESELKASAEGDLLDFRLNAAAARKLSDDQKAEVVHRGARAVTQIQVSALSRVLELLENDIFTDAQEAFYIVIDDLDTQWAVEPLKYKLIRALIETVRAFRRVQHVKIVVALRQDLLRRVISATKDQGFQAEKYESLYLNVQWTVSQIADVVNSRLTHLVRQRYTSKAVLMGDLFPSEIHGTPFEAFLCERTFLRPRDAIVLVNECLKGAADRQHITVQLVSDAEEAFSAKRRISLSEEWAGVFPAVDRYLEILSRHPNSFPASELSARVLESWYSEHMTKQDFSSDPVYLAGRRYFVDGKGSSFEVALALLTALYEVGVVGLKPGKATRLSWSYDSDFTPAQGSIKPDSMVYIHPTFWRALGIRSRSLTVNGILA